MVTVIVILTGIILVVYGFWRIRKTYIKILSGGDRLYKPLLNANFVRGLFIPTLGMYLILMVTGNFVWLKPILVFWGLMLVATGIFDMRDTIIMFRTSSKYFLLPFVLLPLLQIPLGIVIVYIGINANT